MKKITVDNYEEFALDYIECTLDESTRDRFEVFLFENKDLKLELEECIDLNLSFAKDECCSFKEELYRDKDVEDLIITVCEDVATPLERNQLNELLKKDEYIQKELNIYEKLFLVSDFTVVCGIKEQLYKKVVSINIFRYVATIAASLLLFFSIHQYLIEPNFDTPPIRLSQSTPFNASFMPPKYIIECNLSGSSDTDEDLNVMNDKERDSDLAGEDIIMTPPTRNIDATYSCTRESELMDYVEPIGVVFNTELSLEVIPPSDKNIELDWNTLSTSPQKNKYDVKDELDRPLVEEELPENKKQKHRFFRKLKTNLVAISTASFN